MGRVHKHIPGTAFRRNYSMQQLERALQAVLDENVSFAQAEERFGIPRSTIWRKYTGLTGDKLGKPPVLRPLEEKKIVAAMQVAADYGYPFTDTRITLFVQNYLNKKGVNIACFKNNKPGKEWLYSFQKRNPELSHRNCENMKRVKAGLTEETINEYFRHLEREIEAVPPGNIINFDETNLSDDPGKERVFVSRGAKHASRIMDTSKSSTSIMFAGSGDGALLPLYVVYKSKHLYPEWCEGGPTGCRFNRTDSGWFDSNTFEDWFLSVALPYLRRKEGKKVMIGDNLGSHMSLRIIEECEQNNIAFIFLPAHSTHVCQPMDVAVFGPVKKQWRKILKNWKVMNTGVVPKSMIPRLLSELTAALDANMENNIRAGFTGSGIIPLDPQRVIRKLLKSKYNAEENNDAMVRSFVDIMAQQTSRNESKEKPKRKKRIDVPSGKSISVEDFHQEEPHVGPSRRTRHCRQISNDSEEDTELLLENEKNIYDTQTEVYDSQTSEPKIQTDETKTPNLTQNRDDLTENRFVIVRLTYDKGTKKEVQKYFLGQIIECKREDDTFNVKFLRNYKGRRNMFIFPTVEDSAWICRSDIEKEVPSPIICRGVHTFGQDLL